MLDRCWNGVSEILYDVSRNGVQGAIYFRRTAESMAKRCCVRLGVLTLLRITAFGRDSGSEIWKIGGVLAWIAAKHGSRESTCSARALIARARRWCIQWGRGLSNRTEVER